MYGWTGVGKFNSHDGAAGGWRRRASKCVGVSVKRVKLVCEKWSVKRRLDEEQRQITANTTCGRYSIRITDIMGSNCARGTTMLLSL